MEDYYNILGIPRNASRDQIKQAFKKLAVTYHPDKNQGNPQAEEVFKSINEAYQTLSDPAKKTRYDSLLTQQYQSSMEHHAQTYPHTHRRHRSYGAGSPPWQKNNPYGKYDWKNAPRYRSGKVYIINREYYIQQAITLICVIIFAGLVWGAIWLDKRSRAAEAAKIQHLKSIRLKAVDSLFSFQHYPAALDSIKAIRKDHPYESKFLGLQDSLAQIVTEKADEHYKNQAFEKALPLYMAVHRHESPGQFDTMQKIISCHKALGHYGQAMDYLKNLQRIFPENISINLEIGSILLNYLCKPEKALPYFNKAKAVFRNYQIKTYGDAYELLMPKGNSPKLYFDLFWLRGQTNMELYHYEEAIKDFGWAIFMAPENSAPYYQRAKCHFAIGQKKMACQDWKSALKKDGGHSQHREKMYCTSLKPPLLKPQNHGQKRHIQGI